jgi:hypothetical protein
VNDDELHRLHEEKTPGPQTAATLAQSELIDSTGSTVVEELRRHQDGAVEAESSYGDRGPVVSDEECSQSTEGDSSESPRTHETGSLPVS